MLHLVHLGRLLRVERRSLCAHGRLLPHLSTESRLPLLLRSRSCWTHRRLPCIKLLARRLYRRVVRHLLVIASLRTLRWLLLLLGWVTLLAAHLYLLLRLSGGGRRCRVGGIVLYLLAIGLLGGLLRLLRLLWRLLGWRLLRLLRSNWFLLWRD